MPKEGDEKTAAKSVSKRMNEGRPATEPSDGEARVVGESPAEGGQASTAQKKKHPKGAF